MITAQGHRPLSDPPDIIRSEGGYTVRLTGPLVHETYLAAGHELIPSVGDVVRLPDGRHMKVHTRIYDFSAKMATIHIQLQDLDWR